MASASNSRLMVELRDVASQPVPVVFAQPDESDIHHWNAMIRACDTISPNPLRCGG